MAVAEAVGCAREAAALGGRYAVWARALDLQHLAAAGIDPGSTEGRGYVGRGLPPRTVSRSLQSPQAYAPGCARAAGGYDDGGRLWATLQTLFKRIRRAARYDAGAGELMKA